jgi:hypothetical protein
MTTFIVDAIDIDFDARISRERICCAALNLCLRDKSPLIITALPAAYRFRESPPAVIVRPNS